MKKIIRGVTSLVSWAVAICGVGLLVATIVIPNMVGATPLAMSTGSMAPAYPTGSVVVVKPVDGADVAVGEVVTFQAVSGDPNSVYTHRVISRSVTSAGVELVTKGDANPSTDRPILAEQVLGRVIYSLPSPAGFVLAALNGPLRPLLAPAAIVVLGAYALVQVALAIRGSRKTRRRDAVGEASSAG